MLRRKSVPAGRGLPCFVEVCAVKRFFTPLFVDTIRSWVANATVATFFAVFPFVTIFPPFPDVAKPAYLLPKMTLVWITFIIGDLIQSTLT